MNSENYRDLIVKAMLTKREVMPAQFNGDGEEIQPAVYEMEIVTPFVRYTEQIFLNGEDITYSYRTRIDLEGQEVIVFTSCIDQHPTLPSEVEKAMTCKEFVANTWDDAVKDETFQAHYTLTKADAITITEKVGAVETVLKYSGADAQELHKPYGLFANSTADLAAEISAIADAQLSIKEGK